MLGWELTWTGEVAVVAIDIPAVESLLFRLTSPLGIVSETLEFVRDRVFGELIRGRLRVEDDCDTMGVLVSLPGPMLNIPVIP